MGSILQNLEKCNRWSFAQAKKYPPALYLGIVILDGIGQAAASSLNSVFIVQFYRKCKKADTHLGICFFGTLEGTRTPDLLIRSYAYTLAYRLKSCENIVKSGTKCNK